MLQVFSKAMRSVASWIIVDYTYETAVHLQLEARVRREQIVDKVLE